MQSIVARARFAHPTDGARGVIAGFNYQTADMTSRSRGATRPRDAAVRSLSNNERARGMPGEGLTHGPPATKKQAAVTTGSADHRHSPRNGVTAYT
jgi:hypothetical protein